MLYHLLQSANDGEDAEKQLIKDTHAHTHIRLLQITWFLLSPRAKELAPYLRISVWLTPLRHVVSAPMIVAYVSVRVFRASVNLLPNFVSAEKLFVAIEKVNFFT